MFIIYHTFGFMARSLIGIRFLSTESQQVDMDLSKDWVYGIHCLVFLANLASTSIGALGLELRF